MIPAKWHTCALACALIGSHASNAAAGPGAPAVVVFSPATGDAATRLLVNELTKLRTIELIPISALVALLQQHDMESAILSRARALREQGRRALLALDHEKASAELKEALDLLENSFTRIYAPADLAQVHLLRGVVALRRSRPDLAHQQFVLVHQIDPTLSLDAHYSPQVRAEFERAKRSAPPAPGLPAATVARVLSVVPRARLALVALPEQQGNNRVLLKILIYEHSKRAYTGVDAQTVDAVGPQGRAQARHLATRLAQQIARLSAQRGREAALSNLGGQLAGQPRPIARPWYKRWYVWAITGAVLASIAVIVPLATRKDVVDLNVRWQTGQ